VSLAAVSGPSQCVVSGTVESIEALQQKLATQEIRCKRLQASHAFHLAMLDPILGEYEQALSEVTLHAPTIPFVSSLTGEWIRPEEVTQPSYWVRELRETVRFRDGISELAKEPNRIFLEVGAGQTLTALVRGRADISGEQIVLPSCRHAQTPQPDEEFLLNTLGKLWLAGVSIDWSAVHEGEQRRRVPLPTYPFERNRYWIDAPVREEASNGTSTQTSPEPASTICEQKLSLVDWSAAPSTRSATQVDVSSPQHVSSPQRTRPNYYGSYVAPSSALQQQVCSLWENCWA
jgi:acyl transferase domain-containing protein